MDRFYINTEGTQRVILCLRANYDVSDYIETYGLHEFKIVECNVLEYYLFKHFKINSKNRKHEFKWFWTWIKSLWHKNS